MRYILTSGWEDGIADLTERLVRELADDKRVLWLVSGGSNIPASVQVMDNISADLSGRLSVSLADERYGEPGHDDSNWAQLMKAGFSGKKAKLLPVLKAGDSFEQAISAYESLMDGLFNDNDIILGQLGMGADGHIAGILPDSPAAAEKTALVAGYEKPPLRRMTLTFPALGRLSAAYVFAFGKPKQAAMAKLQDQTLEPAAQPAQILKELAEAYIYSDQIGEHG